MRQPVIAALLAISVLTAAVPLAAGTAIAQPVQPERPAVPATLPPIIPIAPRSQMVVLASGAGAVIGVLATDIVTGGMLLSPLGLPSAAAFLTLGGTAPTYSIVQRVFAGIAVVAAAAGGGYLGNYVGRSRPDIVRLDD
jgi:hypothetical protein